MPNNSWRTALQAYSNPAVLALLLLGFAAGLPYMLVFSTLSVWLREAGVARETIGYASLIGLAYAFKWVWSPLLDQWRLPLLGRLGRRRSWLVFSQVLVAIGLVKSKLTRLTTVLWMPTVWKSLITAAKLHWLPVIWRVIALRHCLQLPVLYILPNGSVQLELNIGMRRGPAPTYCLLC